MNKSTRPKTAALISLMVTMALLATVLVSAPERQVTAAALSPQAGLTCVIYQPAASVGKDAYIKQDKPDERRGGDAELRVKTENNKLYRALLQFDLTSLPPDAVISSATLSLYVKGASGGAVTINAHQVTNSWNEAEVTWKARDKKTNLLWTNQGGDYQPAAAASTTVDDTKNVWRTWDLTGLASSWLSSPASNYGVILEASGGKAEKIFKSSDDGTASQRPKLEVCYTAGLTLTPDNSADAIAGSTKTYAHVVKVGSLTTAVNLSAVSSQGWPVRVYKDVNGNGVKDPEDTIISATPSIGPNADYPILVQVDVPETAAPGTVDVATVTATAQTGGATATATDTTRVGKLISVTPNYDQYATAGSVLFYGHTVVNNGDSPICVNITATSSLGWTVLLWEDTNGNGVHETSNPNEPAVANPVCLGAGAFYKLVAEVRVPAGAVAGNVDQTLVKAALDANPVTFGAATDITRVFVNQPPVVDGQYDDVYRNSPYGNQVCYVSDGKLFGKLATYYQPAGDAVYMSLAIDKGFVDNTYGANAVGWPGSHKFSDLVGSDHAQFYGYNADDTLVLDFKLDYLTAKSGTPSGYDSLGVSGGDGKMNVGNAAHIKEWATSLDFNLNSTGYCTGGNCSALGTDLLVDSPATDSDYSPNETYPDWIFDVIYEVKIDIAAFGAAGFGSLEIPYIHASPSKIGSNTVYAEPGVCPGEIGDFVWYDANHNGVQEPGEPGIANVELKLYRDNGDGIFTAADTLMATTTTNAVGRYLFQNLPPDDYFVDVVNSTVPSGYVSTTFNDPTPLISLGAGQQYLDADFGYVEAFPQVEITKEYSGPETLYENQEFTFTIRVHNSGFTTLDVVPLQDWYDPDVLDYLGATPASDDNVDDGVLNWSDLTVGFGRNLAPGETFEVIVRFKAVRLTTVTALLAAAATFAPEVAPAADPVVDGLLDPNYTFLMRVNKSGSGKDMVAPGNLYRYEGADACYYSFIMDRAFNSNVYADDKLDDAYMSQDGWQNKHDFAALKNSDHIGFDLTYPGGKYTGVILDYLDGAPGAWTSGQTGADGSAAPGTGPVNAVGTSLQWNLNNSGWNGGVWGDPLRHSPPYDYYETTGKVWVWHLIYEWSIPKSKTGGACGTITISTSHNSPSKDQESLGRIGDRVWEDSNLNNVQDPNEVGIPGVTLRLYQGGALLRITQTEPGTSGYYIFNNLDGGTYTVDVDESTVPAGYSLTGGTEPRTVSLPSGGSFLDADFGYYFVGTGSIGDRVFYDLNGDGLPDNDANEPGLNGVTVRLYRDACAANGPLLTSQTTAGNGGYLFNRLPAGTYCVRVDPATLPPGVTLTTGNQPLTVNLADGQAFLTADFGYRAVCVDGTADLATVSGARDTGGNFAPPVTDDECVIILPGLATIGDRVWLDSNANGIQDPDEVGLADVTVELFTESGILVASTTTNANGIYQFTGLPAGTYYVQFLAPDGYVFSPQNQGGDPTRDSDPDADGMIQSFTLAPGQTDLTRDAGLLPAANLGDTVWYDRDGNGLQDPGEPGVEGVTVKLYDAAGDLVNTTSTNSNGNYLFETLSPGDYCVEFVAPQGTTFTLPNQGGDDALDSDPDPATGKACVTLAIGQDNRDVDAGLTRFGAIGDFVWYDADRDGIQDVGEPGIPNVTLDLYLGSVKVASTVTDADGGYLFPNLAPGTYTVDVTDLNNVLAGLTHILANQSLPDPFTLYLGPAEINKDVDFGYVREPAGGNAIIGDTVWYDANGDGIQQPGEPGIPDIEVCASPLAGGTGGGCATTDANGNYRIEVPAGSYNVAPTNPPAGYTATTPVPQPVTVAAGQQYLDADFGYNNPNLGRIGNLVFLDNNKNGVFDAGDRAFPGVSVDLIRDTNGDKAWDAGEPIIATVTTGHALDANNGNYLFTGLPTGNYLVHVSDTNAVLSDYTKTPLGTPGADNNNQADPYAVSLPTGGTNLTADFGYAAGGGGFGDPIGAIGNQVWIETDGDGLFDPLHGDFGQPGVTVELLKDGAPYETTTTGASGRYAFLRLPEGNYSVVVSDLADVLAGYAATALGPNPGQDNNNQAQPYAIVLPRDGTNWTADFGYIQPAAIGDYVWYDTNADGVQDVGEPGIGNVTIRLHRDNGDGILQAGVDQIVGDRVTGTDGGYLFTDLTPGTYFVDVTDTQGMLGGLVHTLGPQSKPDPFGPVVLGAGQTYRDADFGYVRAPAPGNAVIGDTVWYDGDGDGVRDPGEPGISGIQVCASPIAGGTERWCDITNATGHYLIEVPAGTYTVAPTNPPADYTATTPVPHGPITVGPGDSYLDADFGYNSPNLGTIGGTVWHDVSDDGVLDPGEPRLPGVSVDLIRDDGDGIREPGEPVIATATTDQNGDYLFQGVPPGNYLVVVSDTQHVLDDFTVGPLGPNPGQDNNNQAQPYAVQLPAGGTNTTADFGYVLPRTEDDLGIIGNQVWYEEDGNGIFNPEAGDIGIAGVTVALYRGATLYGVTTTGAGGDYVFTSLPAGSYSVQVTDDFGILRSYIKTVLGPNPGADNNHQAQPYAISLPPAGINMTADFGYTRPGAIGDFVWYDTNKNGVQDVDEPGIPNVTLNLIRDSIVIASMATDADGGYLFPNLPPGTYVVDVTDLNGKLAGLTHIVANQSQPDPTAPIRLAAGEVYKDADFGYVRIPNVGRAIIGDTVWYDANGDGIQQPGEPGIPDIEVCASPLAGGTGGGCATTDANGNYRIEVLAGSYNVAPTNPPTGYTATTPVPQPVTVVAGQQYLDADFGYDSDTLLGRIGNLVFLDANRDGRFNAGDTALAGVSVDLIRDTNGNRTWDAGEPIIATVTTGHTLDANNGNYLFPGVPAGTYLVHVSDTNAVLTDYIKSPLGTAGADNNNQADPYAVNLPAGGSNLTADFGYFRADRPDVGVIGNQAWIETDANGLFDPANGDLGQAGVTVVLYKDGEPYGLTTTGASGDYSFIGLPAGNYTVTVTDDFNVLAGYVVTTLGPNPGQDNNNQQQPYAVALPTGGYNLTADFGYIQARGSIGDTVFYDDNRSGGQDGNELGIPDVLVQLYGQNQAGACDQLLDTRVTDGNGRYLFTDLAPGNYCVVVPENSTDNPALNTLERTAGPNPHKVSLAPNGQYLDADFGYAGRGPIRGVVFYDWNEDGVKDLNEDTIPDVTVCLYEDLNQDGQRDSDTPVACATTGSDGSFIFPDQLPGGYLIEQTQPGRLSSTTPNVIQANLQLTQGQGFSDGNDFGEILKVRLGDFAYVDLNNNSQPDPGEPGLSGVPIRITGTNIISQTVNFTVTTTNGLYYGADLLPGNYTATAPVTFGPYILHTPANRSTTLTLSFTEDLTLDFGYVTPTSVSIQTFTAASAEGKVNLTWNILGLAPNGFRLWRAENTEGKDMTPVNGGEAVLGDADTGIFRYTDEAVTVGTTYWYWLESVETGEQFGPTSVTVEAGTPSTKRVFLPFVLR